MKKIGRGIAIGFALACGALVIVAQTNPGVTTLGTVIAGACVKFVDRFHIADAGFACGGLTGREVVAAARTYYVNPSASSALCGATTYAGGLDTNSGLLVTTPFRTVQKAVDVISNNLIINNVQVTVQVACDAAHVGVVDALQLRNFVGSFNQQSTSPRIIGDLTTPTNVSWIGAGTNAMIFAQAMFSTWRIGGFNFKPVCVCGSSIFMDWMADIELIGANRFETQSSPIYIRYGSTFEALTGSSATFVGTFDCGFLVTNFGTALGQGTPGSVTMTMSGTPTFNTSFACNGAAGSVIDLAAVTFTGAATGFRFSSSGGYWGAADPKNYPGSKYGYYAGARGPVIGSSLTTYFSSDAGASDDNDCLSTATACATPTAIYARYQQQYDFNANVSLIINPFCAVTPCTMDKTLTIAGPLPGGAKLEFTGDATTPANYILSGNADRLSIGDGAKVDIGGFRLISATGSALNAYGAGTTVRVVGKMDFGSVSGSQILVQWPGARVDLNVSYNVTAGGTCHFNALDGGLIQTQSTGLTTTLTGTPAFSSGFACFNSFGQVHIPSGDMAYSGSASAGTKRYTGTTLGLARRGADTFPGGTSGTLSENAVYDNTIALPVAGTLTNATLANMANRTVKCRITAGTGVPEDCSGTDILTISGAPLQTGPTTWTPADGSGAGLTFTSVNASYMQIGNMVFANARFSYPATADTTAASFQGLPVNIPNQSYAQQCSITYSNINAVIWALPTINTAKVGFYNAIGGAYTNVQMASVALFLQCVYPAS